MRKRVIVVKKDQILKRIPLFFLVLIFLIVTGCSSGGDSAAGIPTATTAATTTATETPNTTGTGDANQNGVRDDVDALIDSKSYTANQKTALKTYANRLEKFISATDDDAINAAADEMTAAVRSTYSEFGADDDPITEIKDKELDTKEKMKTYLQSLEKLNGKID